VLERARQEGRILVSADSDFGTLLTLQEASQPSFILFLQSDAVSAEDYAALLLRSLHLLEVELRRGCVAVFRAGRVSCARVLAEPFGRPAGFELAAFWARWSAEFEASRPRLEVRLAASPGALAAFGEVFGAAAAPALDAAGPPGQDGWRVLTLSFEHERAAVHRLAGFGDQVEILDPPSVRAELLATAREILGRYPPGGSPGRT